MGEDLFPIYFCIDPFPLELSVFIETEAFDIDGGRFTTSNCGLERGGKCEQRSKT